MSGLVATTLAFAACNEDPPVTFYDCGDMVALPGSDRSVAVGAEVELDPEWNGARPSTTVTSTWTLTSRPAGSSATLTNPGGLARFEADVAGAYVADLMVSDGLCEDQASVTITAEPVSATIAGSVLDTTGVGLEGVFVQAIHSSLGGTTPVLTEAAGAYSIDVEAVGEYSLCAIGTVPLRFVNTNCQGDDVIVSGSVAAMLDLRVETGYHLSIPNGPYNSLRSPGEQFSITFEYRAWNRASVPTSTTWIAVGIEGDAQDVGLGANAGPLRRPAAGRRTGARHSRLDGAAHSGRLPDFRPTAGRGDRGRRPADLRGWVPGRRRSQLRGNRDGFRQLTTSAHSAADARIFDSPGASSERSTCTG